jgi:electron transport complex protein RnfD
MLNVIIALLPAWGAACYFFGVRVVTLTAVCIASCIIFEYLARRLMKRDNTITDLSAVVTGLILAMNLPVTLPYWMAVIGSFVAIVIVKQLFGGLGQNFANPAITARIVLMVSFPGAMTNWIKARDYDYDAVSSATPLVLDKNGGDTPSYLDLFLGNTGGCLGETCALALLIGGLYLAARRIISLAAPVSFIGSLALLTWVSGGDPLYHILAGGVFLGAFFMATDYATTPITNKGKIVFGLGCGIITFVIRHFGSYPEGVSFSILLMNILTPYIEQMTRSKVLGAKEAEKE